MLATFVVLATTYGFGESFCGDPGFAVPCSIGATTASGIPFDPDKPHVAIYMPGNYILRKGKTICFLHKNGKHVYLPITDKKKSPISYDLSPAAVRALGYRPTPYWSKKIKLCPIKLQPGVL